MRHCAAEGQPPKKSVFMASSFYTIEQRVVIWPLRAMENMAQFIVSSLNMNTVLYPTRLVGAAPFMSGQPIAQSA